MNYDEYINFKGSRINEGQEGVHGTVKVNYNVYFETETYDDGEVALFVNGDDFQLSKVFKDLRSAKAGMEEAMKIFKRIPWVAIEELKLKGFEDA